MERSPNRPIILGIVTATPILAIVVCFCCIFLQIIDDTKTLGVTGITFIVFAGLTLTVHTIMFFYYFIKMQNLKTINPNHYLLWLLVLLAVGGQLVFWYLFFWRQPNPNVEERAVP